MADAFIGVGSNLGNKLENIRKAMSLIKERCKILKISHLYKTEPVGFKSQQWFLNCAAKAQTSLKPKELLEFLLSIEKKLGRVRTIRYGPRTIDLDILFYDDMIIREDNLVVPHPRLHERLFVLVPLKDICPDFIHPALNKTISELCSSASNSKVSKLQTEENYLN
ncbi:2-amino-4-hydroxy-6-hydroxymethyldihydropteridine diphosphokinase [Candidatus Woesearchaeota archaeon]|nr:2-amino-4-hydroxy-6-hydroxymethyldihydropteridine diphosphokinase [Candidatus Woesearchaeota archaeon]